MEIDAEQRRVLEYVAELNLGGYRPTGREVNEWRLRPEPTPGQKGRLLKAEVPARPARTVRVSSKLHGAIDTSAMQDVAAKWATLMHSNLLKTRSPIFDFLNDRQRVLDEAMGMRYETRPATAGSPAVYEPDTAPEKYLRYLRRLGWIERDSHRRYGISRLGQALLAADSFHATDDSSRGIVMLPANDQRLGYGQVVGRIAACGDSLIADHYLGAEQLIDLLAHTDASRFLIGPNLSQSRVTELKLQITLSSPNSLGAIRELRRASFHDRYIVGEQQVYTLTSSLNGVGKASMALLMEMTEAAAGGVRSYVEDLWKEAERLSAGLDGSSTSGASQ